MRRLFILSSLAAGLAFGAARAGDAVTVTPDNFVRAESDLYFAWTLKEAGGVGRFMHRRALVDVAERSVIRSNRDTLYSGAVFDLDAGPVTVTLPDPGDRFLSMQVISQDEYSISVDYGGGARTVTREGVGTRYGLVVVRILVDPNSPEDLKAVHALQDAIVAEQPGGPGVFDVPHWDPVSQGKVRTALLALGETLGDTRRMFGRGDEVDPVRHLIGAGWAWGGNPERDALYLPITPPKNDGATVHRLTVKDVPVDAFWSITVYDAEGFFEANPYDAYSVNDITASRGPDGSVAVQFGGCDGRIPNCLPIMAGWNYTVRLYRPRAEILSGAWTFPEAVPAD